MANKLLEAEDRGVEIGESVVSKVSMLEGVLGLDEDFAVVPLALF